ncbi:MAG: EF-hand domain-containing protein, partial [Syntrophales bacterium]|nr:EF-hand domain-containing protein [Syntrophales bacterium]
DIFQRYDKDGDGYLTKEEFAAIPGTRSRFEDLDANKDGRLDIEELKRVGERRFQACDSNGDGVLDTREIQVCGEQREERDRVGLFPPPTAPERQQKDRVMDGDLEQSPRYRPAISPVLSVYF